ncbi:hypothetical protein B296_00035678 [Ensete ventricosum]|uniref:WAT1-related protein n=1 Tax=Ensete ventricosum TaxID=4639 RepID=A0A426Z8W4_ENSVE|nr:hypothetical protein B296_00035678 [Ensete ventricosum]
MSFYSECYWLSVPGNLTALIAYHAVVLFHHTRCPYGEACDLVRYLYKAAVGLEPLHCGGEVAEVVEEETMAVSGTWKSVKPYLAMVFLQFGYSGMYVISVASLKSGMSHYVLVAYRNAVAAAVVAPFALWPVLDQNFYYMGAKNTSASFSSALYNVLPAVTFINAAILR